VDNVCGLAVQFGLEIHFILSRDWEIPTSSNWEIPNGSILWHILVFHFEMLLAAFCLVLHADMPTTASDIIKTSKFEILEEQGGHSSNTSF
jgi:hypothetical protein